MRWDRWIFGRKGAVGGEMTTQVEKDIGLHGGMVVDSCPLECSGDWMKCDGTPVACAGMVRSAETNHERL